MKGLWKLIQNGVLIVAPVVMTIYAAYYIAAIVNSIGKNLISRTPFANWRGAGFAAMFLLVVLVGCLWQWPPIRRGIGVLERKMMRAPAISSFYRIVKEITRSVIGKKQPFTQVVLVQEAGGGKRIGLLTADNLEAVQLPKQLVAVYIPFATQLGGDLLLLPPESLEPVDMTVEAALRLCITGGVSVKY
ncbi:DUF502 domain-containing protein [Tumebacillus sp. ITR2]|uniref:DUF502 domain-containing protein n=1 Tax=Tumebacillus amylolyticus TaxID=2801339 RepID=A0ABS1JDZ1_9BACL|nr:DUF502 domain-containing protein [Tumebacillus amylolyticus]MBL0388204.1 DUF502 domain-containing protein [Tumebacillus amylolyticus]